MQPNHCSKIILKRILDLHLASEEEPYSAIKEDLAKIERMAEVYRNTSSDICLQPRHRARARDLEQNAIGLINGIKYALAMLGYTDRDE